MTEEQKEVRRKRALAWNKANSFRFSQTKRLWRLRNRDKINARRRTPEAREANRFRVAKFWVKYPWYNAWQCARQRCNNPDNPAFPRYGGRGVKFLLSKADMQFLWARDHTNELLRPSIDRVNNDGNYALDNCQIIELSHNSRKSNARGCQNSLWPADA